MNDHWGYEDAIYRFYHQSFKLYRLQDSTLKIVETLQSLVPNRSMDPWFRQIVEAGMGKQFSTEHNDRWLEVTQPIVEAYFHARYFLEMACRYRDPPEGMIIPSGWAALFDLVSDKMIEAWFFPQQFGATSTNARWKICLLAMMNLIQMFRYIQKTQTSSGVLCEVAST